MVHSNVWYSHTRHFGRGSRQCRVCRAQRGLIRKYDLFMCRRCFSQYATQIGFIKYD